MITGNFRLNKKIGLGIMIVSAIIILLVTKSMKKYETNIDIVLNENIEKKDLKIILNTYGYLLNGYEIDKKVGQTNTFFALYKDGSSQDYKKTKINQYSDYIVYAKYKDKYAKMRSTNTLVMGQDVTNIKVVVSSFNNYVYISSSEVTPSIESIKEASFKSKDEYLKDKHDIKMLEYLDRL